MYRPNCFLAISRDSWTAEIAVPFRSLGVRMPKPGDVWGINIVRSLRGKEVTQLFCTHGDNHRPEMFGQVVFSD